MSTATHWIMQLAVAVSAAARGGVRRDVLCNEGPFVLRGTPIFVVRLTAIRWDIGLPKFRSR